MMLFIKIVVIGILIQWPIDASKQEQDKPHPDSEIPAATIEVEP